MIDKFNESQIIKLYSAPFEFITMKNIFRK